MIQFHHYHHYQPIKNYSKPQRQQISKPKNKSSAMARLSESTYNLSLIRPSDRVVLYSPIAHCYGMLLHVI